MSYRDDRQALALHVAALERENEALRSQIDEAGMRYSKLVEHQHDDRRRGTREQCQMCNGTLLPVAMFAGHDVRNPLPLKMSTLRFGDPHGGFTHSAPVRSYACTSCGYLHSFIDMDRAFPQGTKLPEE